MGTTLIRYILVDPDGTEHDEYQDPADAREAAAILGCSVRIRYYDLRPRSAEVFAFFGLVLFILAVCLAF